MQEMTMQHKTIENHRKIKKNNIRLYTGEPSSTLPQIQRRANETHRFQRRATLTHYPPSLTMIL